MSNCACFIYLFIVYLLLKAVLASIHAVLCCDLFKIFGMIMLCFFLVISVLVLKVEEF